MTPRARTMMSDEEAMVDNVYADDGKAEGGGERGERKGRTSTSEVGDVVKAGRSNRSVAGYIVSKATKIR